MDQFVKMVDVSKLKINVQLILIVFMMRLVKEVFVNLVAVLLSSADMERVVNMVNVLMISMTIN